MMRWLYFARLIFMNTINQGITITLILCVLLLLRPVLLKCTARQRSWTWNAPICSVIFAQFCTSIDWFPYSFQSLFVKRTYAAGGFGAEYLPSEIAVDGTLRSIVLPFGVTIPLPVGSAEATLQSTSRLFGAATLIWLCGVVVICVWQIRCSNRLNRLIVQGKPLNEELESTLRSRFEECYAFPRLKYADFYICDGLPTSFVQSGWIRYKVALQGELPPEQLEQVLLHEAQHLHLMHCYWKAMFLFIAIMNWYNPLIWVCYRLFCKDIESACDEATVDFLGLDHKADYAETLLQLATAKPMMGSATTFAESHAESRIRAVLRYKKQPKAVQTAAVIGIALLMTFLMIGPVKMLPAGEVQQSWESYRMRFANNPTLLQARLRPYGPTKVQHLYASDIPVKVQNVGSDWCAEIAVCEQNGTWYTVELVYKQGQWYPNDSPTLAAPQNLSGWSKLI